MAFVYPEGPRSVPPEAAKASPAYARHAVTATAMLLLFIVLYLAACGWFAFKAYKLLSSASDSFGVLLAGGCAGFLALFMVKGLFFVKRGAYSGDVEITAREEPALFQFIHRLADEAGAPRPARVYLSARVNAAVFYDISILNLLFPSRKNLEIGLGLVNVLTLEEFKAVLAHEFGHFAQRSMLIGRWVYMAQQIAGAIVAKRDALDRFLEGLSRFDIRIAWIGWILSLIVWAIRSLTDSAFRLVILAQRALSREMEMQADLVAVSLSGSDALVHALHRSAAAEEAWDRALAFADGELSRGRTTADLYDIQSRIIERLRAILDEPQFGRPPARPDESPQTHRVFRAELAEPSRMWATHPSNFDREENAKKVYVAAPLSRGSAWELFADPQSMREKMSAQVVKGVTDLPPTVSREESLRALDAQFEHESFKRFYRGSYIGRPVTRQSRELAGLYADGEENALSGLPRLYPESLAGQLKQLRAAETDIASLQAVRDGRLEPPGGIVRYRGRQIGRRDLRAAIDELKAERDSLRQQVFAHDRMCRSAHRAAARNGGKEWEPYVVGLLHLLHYAENVAADLRDLYRVCQNVVAVETAIRKVGKAGMARILGAAGDVQVALEGIYAQADQVGLGPRLAQRAGYAQWSAYLGALNLLSPTETNINDWLKSSAKWVEGVAGALEKLRGAALDELLVSEAQVARAHASGEALPDAPEAPRAPPAYPVLPLDGERPLQRRLGWWARFLQADGIVPELSRVAVAAGIVGTVLMVSGDIGRATVVVHNGLARPVLVRIGSNSLALSPHGRASMDAAPGETYAIKATTREGRAIESFEVPIETVRSHVYNVASASPLVEWSVVYGTASAPAERVIGPVRWVETTADHVFQDPPASISIKGQGATRRVLSDIGSGDPQRALSADMKDDDRARLALAHARWDETTTRHILRWMAAARFQPEFAAVLAERLRESPLDAVLLRFEQDVAPESGRAAVCERHKALAARNPGNPDLHYVVARCAPTPEQRDQAFIDGYRDTPASAWLAMAAGYTYAEQKRWREAAEAMDRAYANVVLRDAVVLSLARIRRVLSADSSAAIAPLEAQSERLKFLVAVEKGVAPEAELRPYADLARGKLVPAIASSAPNREGRARILRLAAASDGADLPLMEKSLALKAGEGIDAQTLWTSWALAYRLGRETHSYRQLAGQVAGDEAAVVLQQFLESCRNAGGARVADQALRHLTPEMLGHGYAMGLVMLRAEAPPPWREAAKRLLFTFERPYFS